MWILGTILAVLLFCWCTTVGLAFVVTHTSDAYTFGPQHGNSIDVVLGGGDSKEHPTKLIAMNNEGSVQIIKILANDPTKTQFLTVADLVGSNFPDPTNANILLASMKNSVQVTVYGSMYDFPFHRVQQTVTLVGDGNGSFKTP
jgi:hypothetical protein